MAPQKKQQEQEQGEQEEQDEQEEMDDQDGAGSTMIEIFNEEITITVPRDGKESETLQRIAQLADGI